MFSLTHILKCFVFLKNEIKESYKIFINSYKITLNILEHQKIYT